MKTKTILTVLVIFAALLTLSNDIFAQQDLPVFNVTVKGEFCSGLVSGADVYIYQYNTNNQLAYGETDDNGVVALGSQLSGSCPFNVDIKVYYPDKDNPSQTGQLLNVSRSCSNVYYEVCLGSPFK